MKTYRVPLGWKKENTRDLPAPTEKTQWVMRLKNNTTTMIEEFLGRNGDHSTFVLLERKKMCSTYLIIPNSGNEMEIWSIVSRSLSKIRDQEARKLLRENEIALE